MRNPTGLRRRSLWWKGGLQSDEVVFFHVVVVDLLDAQHQQRFRGLLERLFVLDAPCDDANRLPDAVKVERRGAELERLGKSLDRRRLLRGLAVLVEQRLVPVMAELSCERRHTRDDVA